MTEYATHYRGTGPLAPFLAIDFLYAFVFLVEVVLRLIATRSPVRFFWRSADMGWNWLDTVTVAVSVVDVGIGVAGLLQDEGSSDDNASGVRRVISMLRFTRMVRPP